VYLKDKYDRFREERLADICASFQACVVEMLVSTTIAAARDHSIGTIAVGGGVAANSGLRREMAARAAVDGVKVFFPDLKYCTDNATMIAAAGWYRLNRGETSGYDLTASPYLKLV
jgi:N6-L-threonylcarbamoyladenine synthase